MGEYIPLSVPNLCGNEAKYINQALETQWVSTGGEFINQFERNIADYLDVPVAVACQSGTAGLHLALVVSGVKYGDEVIVPTLTFIAAVNPVRYVGAEPIFMDCDDSLCMDMNKLEDFCKEECTFKDNKLINKRTGKHIKAVVVVHIFGNLADMENAVRICDKYNLVLIEDATEALGTYVRDSMYNGRYAGTIGDIGVYSFNGNKIITTGGGGMLVAKNKEVAMRVKYLSTQAKDDMINFIHNDVGYNYRMTNIQAAMGVAQLEKLEDFIATKTCNYNYYKEKLNKDNYKLLDFKDNIRPNYWFYSLLAEPEDKDELISFLEENKIQTRPIWGLVHKQRPYINNQSYKIEKAQYYYDRIINVPCSSNLDKSSIDYVVKALETYKKSKEKSNG